MMEQRKWKLVTCLVIASLAVACSSSPAQTDEAPVEESGEEEEPIDEPRGEEHSSPVVDVDRSAWTQKRRALDEEVELFLHSGDRLGDAFDEGPNQLAMAAREKADAQQKLESKLGAMRQESSGDPELVAWSGFRTAQTYLNFGCELENMAMPEGLTPEQEKDYRQTVTELVAPLVVQAHTGFSQIEELEAAPWSEYADDAVAMLDLVANFEPDPAALDAACAATAGLWRMDGGEGLDEPADIEIEETSVEEAFGDSVVSSSGRGDVDELMEDGGGMGLRGSAGGECGGEGIGCPVDDGAPSPLIEQKTPRISGACEVENVEELFELRRDAFRHCYERELQTGPALAGDVELSFEIDAEGRVQEFAITDSTLAHEGAGECVRRLVVRLRFDAPDDGEACEVEMGMEFSSE